MNRRISSAYQAEIVLKRLDSRKAGSIAFMVIDRRGIDEEILRSYPAMLQRFEISIPESQFRKDRGKSGSTTP